MIQDLQCRHHSDLSGVDMTSVEAPAIRTRNDDCPSCNRILNEREIAAMNA
jgi:hypothetical protein